MHIRRNNFSCGFCQRKQFPVEIGVAGHNQIRAVASIFGEAIGSLLNILQIAINLPPPMFIVEHHRTGCLFQTGLHPGGIYAQRGNLLPDILRRKILSGHGKQRNLIPQGPQRLNNVVSHTGNRRAYAKEGIVDGIILDGKLPNSYGGFRVYQAGNYDIAHLVISFQTFR